MSLTLREEVASLKEKVAGLQRDVVGLEAIVENLDHFKCTTESQLRRIIDATSVDKPFYPSMEEDELVSSCVVCYCAVVYSTELCGAVRTGEMVINVAWCKSVECF